MATIRISFCRTRRPSYARSARIFSSARHSATTQCLRFALSKAPQLWILGEDDLEAPSAETSRRIKTLIVEGKPITLALFPHAEHGMTEYEVASNGERVSTRYAPGYFAMMRDFARNGQLSGSYGSSVVVKPKMRTCRPVRIDSETRRSAPSKTQAGDSDSHYATFWMWRCCVALGNAANIRSKRPLLLRRGVERCLVFRFLVVIDQAESPTD